MRMVDALLLRAIAIASLQLFQLLTRQTIFPTADAAVQAGGTVPSNEAPNSIVAVNQGLIVTGFVRFEGVSVPGLCIELREFRIEDSEDVDDMTVLLSRWEDTTMANSLQLHRTGLDGSFVFVAPESSIPRALYMGFYSQGGDYPTVVRSFSSLPNRGRKGQTANKTFSVWRASGRVELSIDLADELEAAELLWDSPARENDHSPCSTTVMEGLKERPDMWEPQPRHSRRQEITDLQDPRTAIPLQSACWNYGQRDAGLWQEDVALCALLRKPYSGETLHWAIINWSLKTGWKTIALLKDAGRGWTVQATIGIAGLGLCLLVFLIKAGIGKYRRGKSSVPTQKGQSSRLQDSPGHGQRVHQVTISSPMHDTKWGDTNEQTNQEDTDMFPLVFRALSHHDDEIQDSLGGFICGSNFILTRGQG